MEFNDGKSDLDLNPLFRLKEALEGAQKNTSKMLTKLERFETRLLDLDDKMRPIQETTTHYTTAKNNIAATLVEINKTYEHFRAANEVREIINGGLRSATQLDFFDALSRLSIAKNFFEANRDNIKSSGSFLVSIDALLEQAIHSCANQFETLLQSSGMVVECVNGQFNVMNPISDVVMKEIKDICDVLEANGHMAHFKVYQTVRIAQLKAELKKQETANAAAWTTLLQDAPYETGTHPFKEYYLMCYGLLRGELQLWGSTLPSNEASLLVFVAICDTVLTALQRISAPFMTDDVGGHHNERNYSVARQAKMLLVRLDAMETFSAKYEDFRDLCKPDARRESSASITLAKMKHTLLSSCVVSVEFLLSPTIVEGFNTEKGSHFGLGSLTGGISHLAGSVGTGSGNHRAAGGASSVKSSKANDGVSESWSCDSHPVTGHILLCCKGVSGVYDAYKVMYYTVHRSGSSEYGVIPPVSFSDADDFTVALLENLVRALEERAVKFEEHAKVKVAKRPLNINASGLFDEDDRAAEETIFIARKHLFLANNLYAVCNYIREKKRYMTGVTVAPSSPPPAASTEKTTTGSNAGSSSTATLSNKPKTANARAIQQISKLLDKIEEKLHSEQKKFCDTVAATMGLLADDMKEFSAMYAKEKVSNGRVLKAKFTIFNTGLDAFLAQQGDWRVSSAGLREDLSLGLQEAILPVYSSFFSTYSTVKFSKKHMTEYLRFKPADVEARLAAFFGRAPQVSSAADGGGAVAAAPSF